jgi:hypothetical protein
LVRAEQAVWVGLLALLPLVLLLITGLYMFALPYASKWQRVRAAGTLSSRSRNQSWAS